MPRIAIVGGGQSGLQLGLGLLDAGYEVTVASNRTPDEIAAGPVLSSQCMFESALETESALGLDTWAARCPPVEGISLSVPDGTGGKAIDWAARLDGPAQSVDQRIKVPGWMRELERRGGELIIREIGVDDLEELTRTHDLVVVASGKGAPRRHLRARRREVAVRQADAGARPDLRDRDDAAPGVLGGLLQPRARGRGILRLPGAHDYGRLRDHGLRGGPGRRDGLLGGRPLAGGAPGTLPRGPGTVPALGG